MGVSSGTFVQVQRAFEEPKNRNNNNNSKSKSTPITLAFLPNNLMNKSKKNYSSTINNSYIPLSIPCCAANCSQGQTTDYYHQCGDRIQICLAQLQLRCSSCQISSFMFDFYFQCRGHPKQKPGSSNIFLAIGILGQTTGKTNQIRSAITKISQYVPNDAQIAKNNSIESLVKSGAVVTFLSKRFQEKPISKPKTTTLMNNSTINNSMTGNNYIPLSMPCCGQKCTAKPKMNDYYHECGERMQIWIDQIMVRCRRCEFERSLLEFQFQCEKHPKQKPEDQNFLFALSFLGMKTNESQKIRSAISKLGRMIIQKI